MKLSLGAASISLFVLSIIFLVLLTLFESSFSGMSLTAERIISTLLLVVPSLLGVILGVLGILRKGVRVWMSVIGLVLNALFALFFSFLLAFAG